MGLFDAAESVLNVDGCCLQQTLIIIGVVVLAPAIYSFFRHPTTPKVVVAADEEETAKVLTGRRKFDYQKEWTGKGTQVPCWDPSTLDFLGHMPAFTPSDVKESVRKARAAQQEWKKSSFETRVKLMRVVRKAILDHTNTITTVACRDSGKTPTDAMVGEITVTLEKLRWMEIEGERALKPEYRSSGLLNMHKTSRVEWVPVGVVGAVVPWNYPFHQCFNPIVSALFTGNAVVVKASEFASWSTKYWAKLIQACLAAVGAPADLVQWVTGYGDAGAALVDYSDLVIFVGSVEVGRKVMEGASKTLTPVILELGGKDPFIVCEDVDPKKIAQLVARGAYQNMGQNCAGPERFLVYEGVYERFCDEVVKVVKQMKQGPPLSTDKVDCGACVHPPSLDHYERLIDDAVKKGAKVLVGGTRNKDLEGYFFLPTVLAGVTEDMLIAQKEVFGPILCIFKVKGNDDDEAVRIANASSFALSSCAHSKSQRRAAAICARLEAGMSSVNDVEGTTYLSQSLPFGGFKDSGFGRFAGPEGLRGLCHQRSIVENRFSWLQPSIPRQIAYPSNGAGPAFSHGLNRMMYGTSLTERAQGLLGLITA